MELPSTSEVFTAASTLLEPESSVATGTSVASTTSPQTTVDSDLFQLSLSSRHQLLERQAGNVFLGGGGQATDSCTNGVVFSLYNGKLFANDSSTSRQFSTNPGVVYANFTPSATTGSITTLFSVDTANTLSWQNDAFYNFQARFCVTQDSSLIVVFDDPRLAPAGCIFVTLTLSRLDRCAALGIGPAGPTGATGATGPQGNPVRTRPMHRYPNLC
jgi:hypothetical protein